MSLAAMLLTTALATGATCAEAHPRLPAIALTLGAREQRVDFARRAACWEPAGGAPERALVLALPAASVRTKLVFTLPVSDGRVLAAALLGPLDHDEVEARGFGRFDRRAQAYTHTWHLPPSTRPRRILVRIDRERLGGAQTELRARRQQALPFPLSLAAPVNFAFGVEDTRAVRYAEHGTLRVRWVAAAPVPLAARDRRR